MITNAGGLGILCADACEAAGLELPELTEATRAALAPLVPAEASLANPIDLLGSATAGTYEAVIGHVLNDPNVDALVILFVPPVVAGANEVAAAISRAVGEVGHVKPVIAVVVSAEGVPPALRGPGSAVVALPYPESAARALALAAKRADWLRTPAGELPEVDGDRRRGRPRDRRGRAERRRRPMARPAATQALLDAYGIPTVGERVAATVDHAVAAASELGYPVVVKTAAPGVTRPMSGASRSTYATGPGARGRRADRRAGARAAVPRREESSCSPASCRTRCSARLSPSGPAARSPS